MYPHTNKNAILNSLMDFYDTHNGKGFSSVQSAETLGKLFGEDVGNPLIRGLYGTRNRNEVLRELSDSGIVKMASNQYSRMNDEEIAWSIRNPVKALKIKKIDDQAIQESIDLYGTNKEVQTYGKGAQYRHSRRAQGTTKVLGPKIAEHITTIHETSNPLFNPNNPLDVAKRKMDMEYNKKGIELHKQYPNLTDEEIRQKIKEKVEKGKSIDDFLEEQ